MPKIKTHKATSKRFMLTKSKKVKKRKAGQSHFNSKESGKITRMKRKDVELINKKQIKTIKQLISN